ncbi:SDR family NAD(P)-dependent oxidoreductase [Vibrio sp. ZSDZ65]|uniref:SDR family NAD(P)-dependent oxidoreductase n=1 Tax=Vibrio qingdaonensis TaxID=2829491 RepID=A0A9X3HWG4_9VIBR|nr:SDR family NAD(P)-dependent oxidoreductase [Vibrio qingdaonensis]MCW8346371.1 SDR family NAD(P)-dependent oxidoreductase [Vibrio qingdaonensis]
MQKNILVIGASSGIGYDLCDTLVKQGHTVYCGARRLDRLEGLRKQGAHVFKTDVRNEEDLHHIITTMASEQNSIDIVYANAGFAIAGPIEETPIDKVKQQFDTNVYGAARIARQVLPYMRTQGHGRIIFTTSIASRVSTSMNGWYSASKHAVNGMVKALAQEVAGFNIHVMTVEPGCVKTELDAAQLADMKATTSLPVYADIVDKSHGFLKRGYDSGSNCDSTVKAMLTAGFSKKPKLSYQSTLDSKLMFWVQKIIGEQRIGQIVLKLIMR